MTNPINTQFEAWVNERFQGAAYLTLRHDGCYASPMTQKLLDAWEASRADQYAEAGRLKAEIEALRKIISNSAAACGAAVSVECSLEFMQHLPVEIDSVVGGLRKDADRYRWMRNSARSADWEHIGFETSESIDYEIDAAMSKEAGQ